MAQQYCDYAKAFQSRIEREKQLFEKYNQKPEPTRLKSLWMHDIERYESPQELKWIVISLVVLSISVLFTLLYYAK